MDLNWEGMESDEKISRSGIDCSYSRFRKPDDWQRKQCAFRPNKHNTLNLSDLGKKFFPKKPP